MKGFIYKGVVANKVYIGKTTNSLDARIKTHLNHAFRSGGKMHFTEALRSLSEEDAYNAFSLVEVVEGDDYDDLESKLCERENYWMGYYNSFYPNGYNVYRSSPQKKRVVRTQPPRESVMREVICVETGQHYRSMSEAARFVGVNVSAVYHCLMGVNNTAGGMHWRYADGEYHECTRPEGRKNRASQSKPVMCLETGITYPSTGEAERQTGIGRSDIAKCATGRSLQAGGYKWGYVIDGNPVFIERANRNQTRIMCLETGEVFESISACARSLGEDKPGTLQSTIKFGCKHRGKTYVKIDRDGNPVPSLSKDRKV